MHRRTFLAAPLVLALPTQATPHPDISELRLGAANPLALAQTLQRHTAIPTSPVRLDPPALLDALDSGHLEAALLDHATLAAAQTRMGPRLTILAASPVALLVTRTALSASLKANIEAAFSGPWPLAPGH